MRAALALIAALALSAPLAAQQRRELDLDFRPWAAGSLAYLWNANPEGTRAWGVAAGGGIDALDRTLVPSTSSPNFATFKQFLHVGGLHRWRVQRWDLDVGARVGISELRSCDASDCWPGAYGAVYFAPMWGGRVLKIGPRLLTGVVHDDGHRDVVVYVEVLNGRLALRW